MPEIWVFFDQRRRAGHPVTLQFGLGVYQRRVGHALQDQGGRSYPGEIGRSIARAEIFEVLRGCRTTTLAPVHVVDHFDKRVGQRTQRGDIALEILLPLIFGTVLPLDPLLERIAPAAIRIALCRARHAPGIDEYEATDALGMIASVNEGDLSTG